MNDCPFAASKKTVIKYSEFSRHASHTIYSFIISVSYHLAEGVSCKITERRKPAPARVAVRVHVPATRAVQPAPHRTPVERVNIKNAIIMAAMMTFPQMQY